MKKKAVVVLAMVLGVVAISAVLTIGVSSVRAAEEFHVANNVPDSEDSDGDNDFRHIQAAIDAASDGDVVIVEPGTYNENINFAGKAITVCSEHGPAATTIDGGAVGSVVTIATREGADSVLQGFTITNGLAPYSIMGGGGIYCHLASPTINNCIIRGNSAGYHGGGVYCFSSSPVMTNCIISNNSCPNFGGGIYGLISSPMITNCTISGNSAGEEGGGIYSMGECTVTVINSILWGDTAAGSPNEISYGGSTMDINYSDIDGGWSGYGNLDVDPKFVNPGGADFHLQSDSPCIDAGTLDSGVPSDDIEGNLRHSQPDLGAYEYVIGELQVSIDIKPGSDPNCFNNNGHGVIPVAILGNAEFDVSHIDPATVTLEGLAIKVVGKSNKLLAHYEDVNMDGFDDLVVQIEDGDGVFSEGRATATISGALYDGTPIQGSDSICIVP